MNRLTLCLRCILGTLGLLLVAGCDGEEQRAPAPPAGTSMAVPLEEPSAAAAPAATAAPARTAELVYREALAARAARDFSKAAARFEEVVALGPPLAGIARLRTAQALASAGDDGAALAAFEAATADAALPPSLAVIAHDEGARSAQRLGRASEALGHLDAVLRSADATRAQRASACWKGAQLRRDLDAPAWIDDALECVRLAPGTAAATAALDAVEGAGGSAAPLVAAYARYRARQDVEAERLYGAVAAAPPSPGDAANAWFYLGAIAERRGDDDAAAQHYERSLEADARGPLAPDARWWLAGLYESEAPARATEQLQRLVREFPQSRFAREAAMRAGIALARSGDEAGAAAQLRAVAQSPSSQRAAEAARWLEVLGLATPGDPSPSTLAPWSFPALLSAHPDLRQPLPAGALYEWRPVPPGSARTAEADAWLARVFEPAAAEPAVPLDPDLATGLALIAAGEPDVGRWYALRLVSRYRAAPHELLELARVTHEAGLADIALAASDALLRRAGELGAEPAPREVLQYAYPLAFGEQARAAAVLEGIPPLLLLALVRQESAFHPAAESSAGALGLTQVIPATGREIASSLGVGWPADLTNPGVSLRFGAHYLGKQLRRFDGDVLGALAAYNGGPGNAERWNEEQDLPGADGYLHAMEFEETQRYLALVLENYARYRALYAGAPPGTVR